MSVRATADALAAAMTARDHAALMAHSADDVTFHLRCEADRPARGHRLHVVDRLQAQAHEVTI